MKRTPDGKILYSPGDPIKLIDEDDRVPARVLSPLEVHSVERKTVTGMAYREDVEMYRVQVKATGEERLVLPGAIWKEADTGGIGLVRHLDEDEL